VKTREGTFRIAVREFGPFEQAIRAQWEVFEAEHHTGLTLEAVPMDLKTLEEALFHSGGMQNGEWDIGFVSTDWIAFMHDQHAALNLAPLLAAEPPDQYPDGWTQSLLQLQHIDDVVLGVPYHDGPECLIYRRDLFEDPELCVEYRERYSQELKPPLTWEEFHQIARFLQRPERKLFGAVFAAYPDGHNSVYDFLLQLWTRGGELVTSAGEIHFETPAAVEALEFYQAILADEDAVHPGCASLDSVHAGMAFAAGQAAMMINWFGFATMAHTAADSAVRSLVDVAPVPRGEQGRSVSLNVYWLLAIAAGSHQPKIAWQFLRHVLSSEMDKLTTISGAIGCRRSTWRDREVNQTIPFYYKIEELHEYARQIPRRSDWPNIATIIDELITATITSDVDISELLCQADAEFRKGPFLSVSGR
jgi:multiple sugar transport system substrate-binding protein